jgi:hypothetical protein
LHCRQSVNLNNTCQCKPSLFRSLKDSKCYSCPNGFSVYDEPDLYYPYKCYYLSNDTLDFTDALTICFNLVLNAPLMRIKNDDEFKIANSFYNGTKFNIRDFWVIKIHILNIC